jgi:hypothetical protein
MKGWIKMTKSSRTVPPRKISVTVTIEETSTLESEETPTLEPEKSPTPEPKQSPAPESNNAPSSNGLWIKLNEIGYGIEGLRRLFSWLW